MAKKLNGLIVALCLLVTYASYAQTDTVYTFEIHIAAPDAEPVGVSDSSYATNDTGVNTLLAGYTMYSFERSAPSSRRKFIRELWTIRTNSPNLLSAMESYDPDLFNCGRYLNTLATLAPNDFHTSSIVGSQDELKLINAEAAWNITHGDSNVIIGVVEMGEIDTAHADLHKKIFKLRSLPSDPDKNHGTAVLGCVAAATQLFSIPKQPGKWTARKLGEIEAGGLITGASINHSGSEVALSGYRSGHSYPFVLLISDFKDNNFLSGQVERYELDSEHRDWQVESVSYLSDDELSFACEGTKDVPQTLYTISRNDLVKLPQQTEGSGQGEDKKGKKRKGKKKANT